jgi:hypothetical protein
MYPQGLLQMEKQLFELKEGHLDKDESVEVKKSGASEKEHEFMGSELMSA